MKPTGRFAAVVVVLLGSLAGCTSGEVGATNPTGESQTTLVPTPVETVTGSHGTALYTYVNGALVVTVELDGNAGTITVDNGTESEVGAPGIYVLDAVDGHQIEGEVSSAAPVAAGERAMFDLTVGEITDAGNIGLLVLLLGADNYGAFVRTG